MDTPRCQSPTTFMSNMLYASSVLYKSELPMVVVFNKKDLIDSAFAEKWMKDFEAYQESLDSHQAQKGHNPYFQQDDYMISLNRSLSLVMDEFYRYQYQFNIKRF